MELMYPLAIAVGVPVVIILGLLTYGYSKRFKKGRKVANTEFVEKTRYFKNKMIEYKCFSIIVIVSLMLALCILMGIIARPFRTKQTITEIHNRDIFLCLDTSQSMYEVDLEVCEKLKEFVSGLHGERFGITIFNMQTVTMVPLTDDYDYIIQCLDDIETACKIAIGDDYGAYYDAEKANQYRFIVDGTLNDNYGQGSSLIGDGLASTLFQFPNLKDEDVERTRVIILATDNELYGEPFVELSEATELCLKYGVPVFAAAPEYVVDYKEYERCVKSTGGQLFTLEDDNMAQDLIEAVEKTDTSVIYKSEKTTTEYPEALVGLLTIALCVHFVATRRVRL
ncbi:MAG: hypothetical protein J5607_05350 [Clostridiales bacterium]|nr:hypothetical protein [Clostridiales bacterium]